MLALFGYLGLQVLLFLIFVLACRDTFQNLRRLDKRQVEHELKTIIYGDSGGLRTRLDLSKVFERHHLMVVRRRFPKIYCVPSVLDLEFLTEWVFGRWGMYFFFFAGLPVLVLLVFLYRVPLLYKFDVSLDRRDFER